MYFHWSQGIEDRRSKPGYLWLQYTGCGWSFQRPGPMLMFYKAQQVFPGLFNECRYNRYGLVVSGFGQHNKTGMTFYESDDTGVFRPLDQVTFQ